MMEKSNSNPLSELMKEWDSWWRDNQVNIVPGTVAWDMEEMLIKLEEMYLAGQIKFEL